MAQDYNAIAKAVKVVAKTGLFFSCIDGEYADSEKQFIENYINELAQFGGIDEVTPLLDNPLDKHYTLDEVIADTRDLLESIDSPADRRAIAITLADFIRQVVMADGKERPAEREAFIKWADGVDA